MNVKLNDNVLVIAGKDKGKIGKVVSTSPKAGRVTVQGVNLQKKHKKARKATEVSSIVEREGAIDVSNVMVVCDKCGKATRVKHTMLEVDGKMKKVRVCKCGSVLDKTYKSRRKQPPRPRKLPRREPEREPPRKKRRFPKRTRIEERRIT